MPKGRGRKGGAPPRKKQSTQLTETCTRVAMNVGTQVVSDVGSIGAAAVSYPPPCPPPPPTNPFLALQSYYGNPSDRFGVQFSPGQPSNPWNVNPWGYPQYSSSYSSPDVCVNPFFLCFIKGNISVCTGCKNHYPKNAQPPDNLCIKHQEWREFTPAGCETAQSKFSNVYYHCKLQCVWLRCTNFVPAHVDTTEIKDQLTDTHKQYLAAQFGIFLD